MAHFVSCKHIPWTLLLHSGRYWCLRWSISFRERDHNNNNNCGDMIEAHAPFLNRSISSSLTSLTGTERMMKKGKGNASHADVLFIQLIANTR